MHPPRRRNVMSEPVSSKRRNLDVTQTCRSGSRPVPMANESHYPMVAVSAPRQAMGKSTGKKINTLCVAGLEAKHLPAIENNHQVFDPRPGATSTCFQSLSLTRTDPVARGASSISTPCREGLYFGVSVGPRDISE